MKFKINFFTVVCLLTLFLFSCKGGLDYEPNIPQFISGWSIKEPTGVQWSEGENSMIVLYEDKLTSRKRNLILEGQYFYPQRFSQLFLNNELIGEIKLDNNNKTSFNLLLKDNLQPDTLLFRHYDIKSPSDLGMSEDKRMLKLSINAITLQ